jgi:hypothetical protein
MMFVKHKLEGNAEADIPMLQYFSTHPLDLDRAGDGREETPRFAF